MIASVRDNVAKPGERGISLVELIVSMALLGIVLVIVSSLYLSTTRATAMSRSIVDNTKQASNGMNEVARVIRAGTDNPVAGQALNDPAFVVAGNEALILYAYINLDSSDVNPVMIRLNLNANRQLVESRWPATLLSNGKWSFPTCTTPTSCSVLPSSTRTLAGTIAPASGSPWLFTYLAADGSTIPVASGAFLTDAAVLRTIAAVRVNLTAQSSTTDAAHAVTLQNTVGIPNLGLARTGG